jgi:hypothetical protein
MGSTNKVPSHATRVPPKEDGIAILRLLLDCKVSVEDNHYAIWSCIKHLNADALHIIIQAVWHPRPPNLQPQ